jgi:hypothetical protein
MTNDGVFKHWAVPMRVLTRFFVIGYFVIRHSPPASRLEEK